MLRPNPTEIGLTMSDINQAVERIAARKSIAGKARIRQGAERSRDDAMRSFGCVPKLRPPMSAVHFSDSEMGNAGVPDLPMPKIRLKSVRKAPRKSQQPSICYVQSKRSTGRVLLEIPELLVPRPILPSRSGVEGRFQEASHDILQLNLDGEGADASASADLRVQTRVANFLTAQTISRSGFRQEQPPTPLHQSHRMSSPYGESSLRRDHWAGHQNQPLSDGSVNLSHASNSMGQSMETSQSTPNFSSRTLSGSMTHYSMPAQTPQHDAEAYLTSSNAPTSAKTTRDSAGSSSASEAAKGNLPSPLEHISQQAANYRSLVASQPGGRRPRVPRARLAEVLERINLQQERGASSMTPHHVPTGLPTPIVGSIQPLVSPAAPLVGQVAPLVSPMSPAFPGNVSERNVSSAGQSVSYSHEGQVPSPTARSSGLVSHGLDVVRQPTLRHRRTYFRARRNEVTAAILALESPVAASGRNSQPVDPEFPPEYATAENRTGPAPRNNDTPASAVTSGQNLPHSPTHERYQSNASYQAPQTSGSPSPHRIQRNLPMVGSSAQSVSSPHPLRNTVSASALDMFNDSPPQQVRHVVSTNSLNMPSNRSPLQVRTGGITVHADVFQPMSDTRAADVHTDPVYLPRVRPTATDSGMPTRDPYRRNNDFLNRMASSESLEAEITLLTRPTPPPAVGHGRPASDMNLSFGNLPRTETRQLPHWQYDQENSEELAMSVLQQEFDVMHVGEDNNGVPLDAGVMDNTPPRANRFDRYMRTE